MVNIIVLIVVGMFIALFLGWRGAIAFFFGYTLAMGIVIYTLQNSAECHYDHWREAVVCQ